MINFDSVAAGDQMYCFSSAVKAGEIWHRKRDTISYIEQQFPGRMEAQLEAEYTVPFDFLTTYTR